MKFQQPTTGGGGGGGGTVTEIDTQDSITGGPITTSGTINLVNDSNAPGDSMYYGTDSGGTKGFFSLPSGGTPAAPDNSVQFNNAGAFGGNTNFTYIPGTSFEVRTTDGATFDDLIYQDSTGIEIHTNDGTGVGYFKLPNDDTTPLALTYTASTFGSGEQGELTMQNDGSGNMEVALVSSSNIDTMTLNVNHSLGVYYEDDGTGNKTIFPKTYSNPTDDGKFLQLDSSTGQTSWQNISSGSISGTATEVPYFDATTGLMTSDANHTIDNNNNGATHFESTDGTFVSYVDLNSSNSRLLFTDGTNIVQSYLTTASLLNKFDDGAGDVAMNTLSAALNQSNWTDGTNIARMNLEVSGSSLTFSGASSSASVNALPTSAYMYFADITDTITATSTLDSTQNTMAWSSPQGNATVSIGGALLVATGYGMEVNDTFNGYQYTYGAGFSTVLSIPGGNNQTWTSTDFTNLSSMILGPTGVQGFAVEVTDSATSNTYDATTIVNANKIQSIYNDITDNITSEFINASSGTVAHYVQPGVSESKTTYAQANLITFFQDLSGTNRIGTTTYDNTQLTNDFSDDTTFDASSSLTPTGNLFSYTDSTDGIYSQIIQQSGVFQVAVNDGGATFADSIIANSSGINSTFTDIASGNISSTLIEDGDINTSFSNITTGAITSAIVQDQGVILGVLSGGNAMQLNLSDSIGQFAVSTNYNGSSPTEFILANFTSDGLTGNISIGDTNDLGNGMKIMIDDVGKFIQMSGIYNSIPDTVFFNLDLNNGIVGLGDIQGHKNATEFILNDGAQTISLLSKYNSVVASSFLIADFSVGTVNLGDVSASLNATKLTIDDSAQKVSITSNAISGNLSPFNIENVPQYANDAAATGAGLVSGDLYSTTTLGVTALNIVP